MSGKTKKLIGLGIFGLICLLGYIGYRAWKNHEASQDQEEADIAMKRFKQKLQDWKNIIRKVTLHETKGWEAWYRTDPIIRKETIDKLESIALYHLSENDPEYVPPGYEITHDLANDRFIYRKII